MKGTIDLVKTVEKNGKTFYSFKAEGKWYGSGVKNPGNKGDTIEFDVEENGNFLNAGNIKKVAASEPVSSGSLTNAPSTDWAAKDRSISWQAARNSANALLAVGASAGFQDFPDTFSKLVAKSDELTLKFYTASQNPGATSAAKGNQKTPPVEEEPFFDDQLNF